MGRCARKRMEEMFDKKRIVEQTVEIIGGKDYRQLVGEKICFQTDIS